MEYTKEQVIQFTISNLSDISIPARLSEQIGIPIQRAITNLEIVLNMFAEDKKPKETAEIDDIDFGGDEDEREADAE